MIQNSMNIPCLHKDNTVVKWKIKKRTIISTTIFDMITSQFEIVCDLTICSIDNVSERAGFESCLGMCN